MAAIPVAARVFGLRKYASPTPRTAITGEKFLKFARTARLSHRARSSGDEDSPVPAQEPAPSPADSQVEALEARLKSRRRKRRSEASARVSDLPSREIKPWEEMSLGEKAWEVYVGEKGMLFWLNKLAYASIFVIAGGWIVFRFVGPALGWYQLDSPLMAPDKLFTGTGDVKPPA